MPVPAGAIRGMFWSLGTGIRYFTGRFEPRKARAIALACRRGETAWDVGAHRGYCTLIIGKAVGPEGRVFAFEPDTSNQVFLRRHLRWNRLRNVERLPYAVADFDAPARFKTGRSSLSGKLDLRGNISVEAKSPRSLIESGQCERPTFLKVDAEGAEAAILSSFAPYLENPDLCAVVSTDSLALHSKCTRILRKAGCTVIDSGKRGKPNAWERFGDVELFAFGENRPPSDELIDAIQAIGAEDAPDRSTYSLRRSQRLIARTFLNISHGGKK